MTRLALPLAFLVYVAVVVMIARFCRLSK